MRDRRGPTEYEPEYRMNPVPSQPDSSDPDDDDEEYLRPEYVSTDDYSEPSGSWKKFQLGCGVFLVLAIVLAIVIPVAATCGGSSGGIAPGRASCELLAALVTDSSQGRIATDAEFIERAKQVVEAASDIEGPIADSSAAMAAAAAALDVEGFQGHFEDLALACQVAGHWSG